MYESNQNYTQDQYRYEDDERHKSKSYTQEDNEHGFYNKSGYQRGSGFNQRNQNYHEDHESPANSDNDGNSFNRGKGRYHN
jgi:hypothetical protein